MQCVRSKSLLVTQICAAKLPTHHGARADLKHAKLSRAKRRPKLQKARDFQEALHWLGDWCTRRAAGIPQNERNTWGYKWPGADQRTAVDITSMESPITISRRCPSSRQDTQYWQLQVARKFFPYRNGMPRHVNRSVESRRAAKTSKNATQTSATDEQRLLMRGSIRLVQVTGVSHRVIKSRYPRSGCRFEMRHRQLPACVSIADNVR